MCMNVHTCAHTHTHTHKRACTICSDIGSYFSHKVYMCMNVHTCAHTHTHTHTYTHTERACTTCSDIGSYFSHKVYMCMNVHACAHTRHTHTHIHTHIHSHRLGLYHLVRLWALISHTVFTKHVNMCKNKLAHCYVNTIFVTNTHTQHTHMCTHTCTCTHTDWACNACSDFGFLFLTLSLQSVYMCMNVHTCAHTHAHTHRDWACTTCRVFTKRTCA